MMHEEFLNDWKERYTKGTCTLEHLERLHKIGKLSIEDLESIKKCKEAQ